MNNSVKMIFSFALGAAAGSLVAWRILEPKYRRIADEAIADVKARYSVPKSTETHDEQANASEDESDEDEPDDVDTYIDLASAYGSDDGGKENLRSMIKPHVIPPEDFDTFGYETVSLTYYADGVLTDEWDHVIKNADEIVGEDFAEHFGEYEDDSVFVRNDDLKCDYEILRDLQTFADAMGASDYDPED